MVTVSWAQNTPRTPANLNNEIEFIIKAAFNFPDIV